MLGISGTLGMVEEGDLMRTKQNRIHCLLPLACIVASLLAGCSTGIERDITIEWSKDYGTEDGVDNTRFDDVAQFPNGGYAVLGRGAMELPEGANDMAGLDQSKEGTYFIVANTDSQGKLQWVSSVESSSIEAPVMYDMAVDIEGGIVEVGFRRLEWEDDATGVLVKYSPDGDVEWVTELDKKWLFYTVVPSGDGGCILGGGASILRGRSALTGDGAVVAKYDADGNEVWLKQLEGVPYSVKHVIAMEGGRYLYYGFDEETYTLGVINEQGVTEWVKTADQGEMPSIMHKIIQDEDGGFVAVGEISTGGELGGVDDFLIMKFSEQGDVVWSKSYGGSYSEEFTSVAKSDGGGYVAVGYIWSDDMVVGKETISEGAVIAKLDADGDLEWLHSFGVKVFDSLNDIIRTDDGGFVAVGKILPEEKKVGTYARIMKFTLKE
jgi:hypothetical protein